ncbi:MAG: hypothetical protein GC191_14620 [Azospirillum sp.]|nr:hypothetical protein [Azospirillum sp.]
MSEDILTKLGLQEGDLDWLANRVANHFQKEIENSGRVNGKLGNSDVAELADAVTKRMVSIAQLDHLSRMVAAHIATQTLMKCSGADPNCACAEFRES